MNKKIITLLFLMSSLAFANSKNAVRLPESNIKTGYIEIDRLKSTKNIVVLEKKDIQDKGYLSLEEVLDTVPSINVGKAGWGEIDIRGQGDDYGSSTKNIQILIDGAPITVLTKHPMTTNYNVVPVENIEKIEIIPGGGSVVYGTGSVGGIINITTNLKNMHKAKNDVALNIGTNKKDLMLNVGHNFNDKLTAQVSFSRLDRNLYFVDTYRKTNYFSAGLNYKIKENDNLSFKYSKLNENGKFVRTVNYNKFKNQGKDYRPDDMRTSAGLDANGKPQYTMIPGYLKADREIDSYNLAYSKNMDPFRINIDLFYDKGYFTNVYDELVMDTKTKGIKTKIDYSYGKDTIFEGSSILFGFDHYKQSQRLTYNDLRYDYNSGGYNKRVLDFQYDKETRGFYFLNNLKFSKFDFSQGIRRDLTKWGFDKVAAKNEGKDDPTRSNTNYELALAYNYRDTGKIYARYEKSFTSPDGLEITDDFSSQPITATKGEDTIYDMYEIGIRDKIGFSTVVLSAFYNKTNNEMSRNIMMDPTLGFGRKSINILKTKRKGIELSLSQKFGNLTLEENYAYLKGVRKYNGRAKEFVRPDSWIDWTEAGLKKVPKHALTLKAKYEFNDNFSANIRYKYLGKYSNFVDEGDFKEKCNTNNWGYSWCSKPKFEKREDAYIKSYSIVDLGMNYKNENGISISAGINNLFDKKYFEYSGGTDRYSSVIPAEGRNYYLGMKYTF